MTGWYGLALCVDETLAAYTALLVFTRATQSIRLTMMQDLENLIQHAIEQSFVPCLVIRMSARTEMYHLRRLEKESQITTKEQLKGYGSTRDQYGESYAQAQGIARIMTDALNVRKLAQDWSRRRRLQATRPLTKGQFHQLYIRDSIEICTGLLSSVMDGSNKEQERCTRQLNTALAILAYQQQLISRKDQQTSIQIARASESIAAETRADGAAMKTLAVVTVCFLHATSVSSVFSMSFFDWQPRDGSFVGSRFWIYCIVAIVLTLLTVKIWYWWQRSKGQRRIAEGSEKV